MTTYIMPCLKKNLIIFRLQSIVIHFILLFMKYIQLDLVNSKLKGLAKKFKLSKNKIKFLNDLFKTVQYLL